MSGYTKCMKNSQLPSRTLHLMDIENLLGTGRPAESEVLEALEQYSELVDVAGPNQVIVACNHGAARVVGCCLGEGPRLLIRSGRDGADLALLDVLCCESVERRFDHLVLASGDGIFAERVAEITSLGVPVTVVARRTSLAARLRLAATEVIFFEPTYLPDYPMAVAA
jgi:hypothetical protein